MIPKYKHILAVWLILVILVSVRFIAPWASSQKNPVCRVVTESIDRKVETTLELSAASAAASLAVSALPGDTATPISEKLADFGTGFLGVLCVLYFEKFLFPIIGLLVFGGIFPLALLLFIGGHLCRLYRLRTFAVCLAAAGLLSWTMIPVGTVLSDFVYAGQQGTIQQTISDSGDLSMEISEGTEEGEEKDKQNIVSKVMTTVSSFSTKMVGKAKQLITGFLRALALMLVTACVIPVAVMLAFAWLIKAVIEFGIFGENVCDFLHRGRGLL